MKFFSSMMFLETQEICQMYEEPSFPGRENIPLIVDEYLF